MNRRQFIRIGTAAALGGSYAARAAETIDPLATPPDALETHRLRIVNHTDGAIQVSTDGGTNWRLLGRVLIPATTVVQGYIAADYAAPGTVAAIAVHGHRIRVSSEDPTLHAPLILSLDPREYAGVRPNRGYGGHRPGSAGIYTDIAAGTTLFRELAPRVGSPVLREDLATGRLLPLSNRFKPDGRGEIIIIPVRVPKVGLSEIVFENCAGGDVTGTFTDGSARVLTQVVKPVAGIGRFDGTAYTGVGRLNTAHTGVITVCTAPVDGAVPEGTGKERRGGFQIAPAWHNARTEEAGAPMVLILGVPGAKRFRSLEGTAPLFLSGIGLDYGADAGATAVAEMAVDGGAWEPLPAATGDRPNLWTGAGLTALWKARGVVRTAQHGVTAFRLRFPPATAQRAQVFAVRGAEAYSAKRFVAAERGEMPVVSGNVTINANPDNRQNVVWMRYFVEGRPKGFTNNTPFTLSWDSTRVPDGEYLIEAEALDGGGSVVARTKQRIFVRNHAA